MLNNQPESYHVANFINSLGASDLHSFYLCLEAYNNLDTNDREPISDVGFNQFTGYIYLALESGINICSRFGRPVIYSVYSESGDQEFDTHFEACEFWQFGPKKEYL